MTIWMKHSRRYKRHGPLVDMLGVGVEQLRHNDDGEEGRHQQHWNIDCEGTFAFLTTWYRWARTRRGTVSMWRARWASPPSSSCGQPRPGPGRPAGSSSGSCCSCQGETCNDIYSISTQYLPTKYLHLATTSLRLMRYLLCSMAWNVLANGGSSYMHWPICRYLLVTITV